MRIAALLGSLGVASLLLTPAPSAAIDWLVLVVDRSSSIDDRELTLQRDAYVRLLSDDDVVSALGGARVSVVEFDSRAEVVVNWTDPETAALVYSLTPPSGERGQTGIGAALATALRLLDGKSGRMVIDVSGDGRDNVDHLLLHNVRAAADARAIEINGLAIMTPKTSQLDRYYRRAVVNGFVLPVDQREDFLSALKRKLFYEIAGVAPTEQRAEVVPRRRR